MAFNVQTAKKTVVISEGGSTKQAILRAVGDLSDVEIFYNQILIATRPRPRVGTLGGKQWYHADDNIVEDQFQSKIGLVLKLGPTAFQDDESVTYDGQRVDVGDWIVFSVKDGSQLIINDVHCRLLGPLHIKMRVKNPDTVNF